jgi:response regulator of citrate/malate metabolism
LLQNLNGQILPLTASLQQTLLQTQTVIKHLDSRIEPLAADIHNTQKSLDEALRKLTAASEQTETTMTRWESLASDDSKVQQQVSNGASLSPFSMKKYLKILAKNGIIGHEKYNANVPGIPSADPAPKTSFSPAETC